MTVFQLECFCSLAETLSFTQTANEMFITQPTLSRTIATLEKELDIRLLQRNTHKVTLTPAGKVFYNECTKLLYGLRQGINRSRAEQNDLVSTIYIGLQRDVFEPFAVDFINEFQKRNPNVDVNIIPSSPTELLTLLMEKKADAVIAGGMPPLNTISRLLLSSRKEYAALPPGHPLAKRKSLDMRELKNEDFIVMSRTLSSAGYESINQKALDAGFELRIVAQADYVPILMTMVACGKGVSILHKDMIPIADGKIAFVPLENVCDFERWLMWDDRNSLPCLKSLIALGEDWQKKFDPEIRFRSKGRKKEDN